MAIQTEVNAAAPLVDTSRTDARATDVIELNYVGGPFVTIGWSLTFTPDAPDGTPSTAVLSAFSGTGPITFTIDNEGSYMVRQAVDDGVSITETYVYVSFLTVLGNLRLIAGGERRDGTTPNIPVDATAEGWADEQNMNIQTLLGLIQHSVSSGRIIYVDANRGKDNSNTPNDPAVAEGFADFNLVDDAVQAALFDPTFNGGVAPSPTSPVIVAVREGFYEEDVTFEPYVHVIGWPSTGGYLGDTDQSVRVRGNHVLNTTGAGEFVHIHGVMFENVSSTASAVVRKVGLGQAYLSQCRVLQSGDSAGQGPGIAAEVGSLVLDHCTVVQTASTDDTAVALELNPTNPNTASVQGIRCRFEGTSAAILDSNQAGGVATEGNFVDCDFVQVGAGAGSFCADTFAPASRFDHCTFTMANGAITDAVRGNPGGVGTPGDMLVAVRRSILGDPDVCGDLGIDVDDTGVTGTPTLQLGSSEYSVITVGGTVVQTACIKGTSLFYDNTTSGIGAENVQDALDQIFAVGGSIANLDDAYDGYDFSTTPPTRLIGGGRVILADADAVEIHGPGVPADPPPEDDLSGDGSIRVVQAVEVGAINAPEMALRSNFFGNGPLFELGNLIWSDSAVGSSGYVVAGLNSPGGALFRMYNLRLQTFSGEGNSSTLGASTQMGAVIVQGGSSYAIAGVNSPDGGPVYVIGGNVDSNNAGLAAVAGDIFLAPGLTNGALATEAFGTIHVTNPLTATAATLDAGANFVDAGTTPAGTITFATSAGKVAVTFLGGEVWAGVGGIQELLQTDTGIVATWPGGATPITLTTTTTGPTADIVFISDSLAGVLNTYLGGFTPGGGAVFTAGTYPDTARLWGAENQIIKLDSVLSQPQIGEASIPLGQNGIFISDGTGGAATPDVPWYKDTVGTLFDLTTGGGGGAPVGAPYVTIGNVGALTGERALTVAAGELTQVDGGANSTVTMGLATTAVVPGAYTNTNLTVDGFGRLTAVASGVGATAEKLLSRQMLVPIGVVSPNVISEYQIIGFSAPFVPVAAACMVNIPITPMLPGNVLIDIDIYDAAGVLAGPLVATFSADSIVVANSPVVLPIIYAGPAITTNFVMQIKMTHPGGAPILITGDGLVVSVTGTA